MQSLSAPGTELGGWGGQGRRQRGKYDESLLTEGRGTHQGGGRNGQKMTGRREKGNKKDREMGEPELTGRRENVL